MENTLSNREFEVVAEASKGYSMKEIADRLYISPHTVDTHLKKSKKKFAARNMADLTRRFVLSLDNPKEFYKKTIAVFFIGVQIFISISDTDIDLRRSNKTRSRIAKVVRVARKVN